MTFKTFSFGGNLRVVLVGFPRRRTVYMVSLSRSWSLKTHLMLDGRPSRSKRWTKHADQRRFQRRLASYRARNPQ